mgnify:CR=1 FL=1
MTASASVPIHFGCAVICLVWTALMLSAGRQRSTLLPAAACTAIALWAGAVALDPEAPLSGPAGALEIARSAVFFVLLLGLCFRFSGPRARPLTRRFAITGAALLALLLLGTGGALASSVPDGPRLLARLGLAVVIVLLAENLYRNASEAARWHVVLPCIALGGIAAFEILLYADALLSYRLSPALLDARAALSALAVPLLAIAAVRDQRLRRDPPVSREVVFHSATLVVAGAFLLGVGAAGEAFRHLEVPWGQAAQASLLAGAIMALAVAATSRSVRSRLRRLVVDHFFTARYDYRREWLRCVATLSAPDEQTPARLRAIRAIADAVDSPAGVLLLREAGQADLHWAASWNLPSRQFTLPAGHNLIGALRDGTWIAEFGAGSPAELAAAFGPLWLGVPLPHHREGLLGLVLLAPPRAAFALDREVFDLLRTLGGEVAMFLAERRAAERLAEQRRLQDYARRFAFVAHDVKAISSQLTLLLANAEDNLQDPDFQRDMLLTVRASADRINSLIARLRQPEDSRAAEASDAPSAPAMTAPLARLRAIAAMRPHPVLVEDDGQPPALAAIASEQFDRVMMHLLDNAAEASEPGMPIRIRVRHQPGRVVVDIADRGPGMTPEFIRDELFRPLGTSKPQGNGIGAWQARELVREAGGDLVVLSRPGVGTTMRITLPAAGEGRALAQGGRA